MMKRIQEKLKEGIDQIATYMKDERLANRPQLKKFVVVFSGATITKLEEI